MSWGTEFTANIFISRMHFNSVDEVELEISATRKQLDRLWRKLLAYMAATPHPATDADGNPIDPIEQIMTEHANLREEIEDKTFLLADLLTLKENFENRIDPEQ